ncbi:MAG: TylF/MycF/NovP-related O-methyltransferase [Pseudomonadota bacterium]
MTGGLLERAVKPFREAAKTLVFRYTTLGAPKYAYNIEPAQLALLVSEIDRLRDVKGNIVEIGVARGLTTRFLCQHIVNERLDKTLTLYAVDTFSSFVPSDLDYEVKERGKSLREMRGFAYNDYDVWRRNFSAYPFVQAIQADCATVDYGKLAPIKIAFLDVDLYLPTKKTLPKLHDALVDGGVILVDDVLDSMTYDGAYQAYMEFCRERGLPPTIVGNKCGVVYKK